MHLCYTCKGEAGSLGRYVLLNSVLLSSIKLRLCRQNLSLDTDKSLTYCFSNIPVGLQALPHSGYTSG